MERVREDHKEKDAHSNAPWAGLQGDNVASGVGSRVRGWGAGGFCAWGVGGAAQVNI